MSGTGGIERGRPRVAVPVLTGETSAKSRRRPRDLEVGESWLTHTVHQKGFDAFYTSRYEEGGERFSSLCAMMAALDVGDESPQLAALAGLPRQIGR